MTPWVTRLIFGNAGMFLLQMLVGRPIIAALALQPISVPFRPWTPITYMFLHGDLWHLLFNMLGLFFFGPRVEARLGSRAFLGLYLASGLTGALLSLLTPYAVIIGASGAVFGVFFAFARYWPHERIYIWGILPVEARVLVVVATVFSLWAGYQGGSGVAHFAHLGGFLGGYLFLKLSERRSTAAEFRARASMVQKKTADDRDVARWQRIRREDLHPLNREELNRILDKISATGIESLTVPERAFLERFSQTH